MTAPFRDPAESPTAIALARLRSRPAHPIRLGSAAIARYRSSTSAAPHARDIESATRAGFELVGNAAEGLVPTFRKRVYVDAARTTQAQLSSRGYFFITYFESGHCIITWDHEPRTPSSDMLLSLGTTGSFTTDYDAHVAEVAKRAATDAPIVVRDLADAIALGDFYYRSVVPVGLAALAVINVLIPFALLAALLFWFIARR